MTTVELAYICDACGRPVEDGQGCIIVSYADLAEWRRIEPAVSASAIPGLVCFTGPILAPWRIQHDACATSSDGYYIDVERIRTWRNVVEVTSELLRKPWLTSTDWGSLVGDAARAEGQRVVPLDQRGDAA